MASYATVRCPMGGTSNKREAGDAVVRRCAERVGAHGADGGGLLQQQGGGGSPAGSRVRLQPARSEGRRVGATRGRAQELHDHHRPAAECRSRPSTRLQLPGIGYDRKNVKVADT